MSNEIVKNDKEKVLPQFRPATDIMEQEDGFYIYMDLPGVPKENLVIDLEENELTVTAKTAIPGEGESYGEMQFGNGEYHQTVSLSDIVDRERIAAKLQDGVLRIHLPRVVSQQPRKIEITQG